MDQHLLSIILFAPLAGMLVLLLIPSSSKNALKLWANLVGFACFLISLPLVTRFDKNVAGYQMMEKVDWIPSLGAKYLVGIDGISLLLVMLTTLVSFLAILSSWNAIEDPMFPFHTWLPDAHVEAPTAGSVILASVLLKMGTYGFLRFSLPLLPKASIDTKIVQILAILSIVGILYGALVSLMQQDWKKLIAYSSVSHLGFCTLGIFAVNPNGIAGSVIQQINHGISTGMLFLIIGIVYERRHTREISEYGGLAHVMPKYAVMFAFAMLSSAGLPLLNGFVGEFTILQGAFEANRAWAAFAVSGVILGAAYLLWLYQRTMLGQITNGKNLHLPDLSFREMAVFAPFIAWGIWIGIYPKPYFDVLEKPVAQIVERVRPGYYAGAQTANAADPLVALPAAGNP